MISAETSGHEATKRTWRHVRRFGHGPAHATWPRRRRTSFAGRVHIGGAKHRISLGPLPTHAESCGNRSLDFAHAHARDPEAAPSPDTGRRLRASRARNDERDVPIMKSRSCGIDFTNCVSSNNSLLFAHARAAKVGVRGSMLPERTRHQRQQHRGM